MAGDSSLAVDFAAVVDVDSVAVAHDSLATTAAQSAFTDELPAQFRSTAELEAWLIEAVVAQWGHLFGQTTNYPYWNWGGGYIVDDIAIAPIVLRNDMGLAAAFDTDVAALSGTASSTNVQVEGVDEADLVETDGEYLYVLSGNDLVIVRAGIGEELQVLSRVRLDGRPVGMYLAGDRLAIVSSSGGPGSYGGDIGGIRLFAADYGYVNTGEPPTTTVTLLDVSDRSAPTLVQKSQMDGQLVASRVVDGELRLVLNNSIHLPMPIARPVEGEATLVPPNPDGNLPLQLVGTDLLMVDQMAVDYWYPVTNTTYVYETQDAYLARVRDELFKSATPGLKILGLDGSVLDERPLVEATDVYRPESPHDRNITTIATFDLASNEAGPAATTSVFGSSPAQVYATADSIYLFSNDGGYNGSAYSGPTTTIRKFDFDSQSHEIVFSARGKVEGTLLNQFAADEHDGYLRVVTSTTWSGGQSVFVLQQVGRRLNVVGSVEEIAVGEQIYSVRFMGERAFLVTFRKVDPLFALDLADPTNPKVLGELKIPGYSDYLQPLDENHLLAIGRGANEATGLFQELQVSIFDVSDMTDPQLSYRYSFDGGRSTATPVTGDRWQRGDGDHHVVAYYPDEHVFAIPVFSADGGGGTWGGVDNTPIFEPGKGGLQVFRVDVDSGFTPIGLIQHDTLIERSVQIGEHLFAISSGTVTVHELADPTAELGSLSIGAEDGSPLTELTMFRAPQAIASLTRAAEPAPTSIDVSPSSRWQISSPTKRPQVARRLAFQNVFSAMATDDLLLARRVARELPSRPAENRHEPVDEVFAGRYHRGLGSFSWADNLANHLIEPPTAELAG